MDVYGISVYVIAVTAFSHQHVFSSLSFLGISKIIQLLTWLWELLSMIYHLQQPEQWFGAKLPVFLVFLWVSSQVAEGSTCQHPLPNI